MGIKHHKHCKRCKRCRKPFIAARITAIYCGQVCKQAAYRARKRA